jgi:hypothetical protein
MKDEKGQMKNENKKKIQVDRTTLPFISFHEENKNKDVKKNKK